MAEETRSDVLRKAVEGDAQALGILLQEYRPLLRILARRQLDRVLAPRVDPSDIVQQTCLEVHRDLAMFRGDHEGQFIAWIRRILENSVRDMIEMHIGTQKRSLFREDRRDLSGDGRRAGCEGSRNTVLHRAAARCVGRWPFGWRPRSKVCPMISARPFGCVIWRDGR